MAEVIMAEAIMAVVKDTVVVLALVIMIKFHLKSLQILMTNFNFQVAEVVVNMGATVVKDTEVVLAKVIMI